jgi:hypothetical protein
MMEQESEAVETISQPIGLVVTSFSKVVQFGLLVAQEQQVLAVEPLPIM